MNTRVQRIVFWCLFAGIVAMGCLLAFHRQHFRNSVVALAEDAPLDAPTASTEPITLLLANDADGAVTATNRQIALPQEATARVRSLLDHLNAEYALPGSAHPLPPGTMVDDVFLLPLPIIGHTQNADQNGNASANISPAANATANPPSSPVASTDPGALQPQSPGGELAVVNLRSNFVSQHPSGVEVESLTLLSIIGTLHANVPQIEQVRFLVDGQPRETLAGHADLLRTYPSRDTSVAASPLVTNPSVKK
jgi:hypothetical protein